MNDLNHEKLGVMLKEWRGVLEDKMRVVGRLRHDLEQLDKQGKKADVSSVLAFYDSVRVASKAAGKVELLEQFVGVHQGPGIRPAATRPERRGFHL